MSDRVERICKELEAAQLDTFRRLAKAKAESEAREKSVPTCRSCGRGTNSNSGLCSHCIPMMRSWP